MYQCCINNNKAELIVVTWDMTEFDGVFFSSNLSGRDKGSRNSRPSEQCSRGVVGIQSWLLNNT